MFVTEHPIRWEGPGGTSTHFVVPPPSVNSSYGTFLDPVDVLLHKNIDQLYKFTHHLCYELDGAHNLADSRHALTLSQHHELLVKFNSMKEEYDHMVNDHLIPLQRFTAGVISSLSVLSGTDPMGTVECAGGGCPPPPQPNQSSSEDCPPPISPIPIDVRAFGLDPTNYSDIPYLTTSAPSSIPNLISVSSLSEESVLHTPSSSSPRFSGEYFRLRRAPHWSDFLLDHINFQDYYFLAQEEAFISSGESGEQETVRSIESNTSGSDATSSDGSEEVLASGRGSRGRSGR